MRAILLLFVLVNAGCLRKTEFQCSSDGSCGAGGRCEPTSYCSFIDADCASGRRYDQSAGPLAGQCTGGGTGDGGMGDGPMSGDGPPSDMAPPGCPGDYTSISGGEGSHVYKKLTVAENWNVQENACQTASSSSHLAAPADATELGALDNLAGGNDNKYWLGITDSAVEMTWRNTLGGIQTYLPWQPPAPDNNAGGQGEDCVESLTIGTPAINDRRCQDKLPAICECAPP